MKKVVVVVVVILILAAGIAAIWADGYLRKGFPVIEGEIEVPGLKAPVEILRDTNGIPHILAQNIEDMLFGQGYVHAQDRLFQMCNLRRFCQGRISEVAGEAFVDMDRFQRAIGIADTAARIVGDLETERLQGLKAYCRGVNYFMETHAEILPVEFRILKEIPEPWTPRDVVSIMLADAWLLGENFLEEIIAEEVRSRLGDDALYTLFGFRPTEMENRPATPERESSAGLLQRIPGLRTAMDMGLAPRGLAASNNWAIGPAKSASGKPMLANDPHLPLTMPGFWYEAHLVCPELNVIGATIAGTPFVIIGHNGRVAWGLTNVMTDNVDLYLEKINPENRSQYEYRGQWLDLGERAELIRVRGREEPVKVKIHRTVHGPLVTDMQDTSKPQLAVKWTGADEIGTLKGFEALNRARDYRDVIEAARSFHAVSQNIAYADIDGNFGWQACGTVPVRTGYSGKYPVDGSSGRFEWTGYLPFEELPAEINPARGYVATANTGDYPADYPHVLSHSLCSLYRKDRISELIEQKDRLGFDDVRRIQADVYSQQSRRYVELVKWSDFSDERALLLRQILAGWDGQMRSVSSGAAVFGVFLGKLWRNLLQDELGDLMESYILPHQGIHNPLDEMIASEDLPFWDDVSTTDRVETRGEIVEKSLIQTHEELSARMGPEPTGWEWGLIHGAHFRHPFGAPGLVGKIFNHGPVPVSGDMNTVFNSGLDYRSPYDVFLYSSYRIIVDMDDPAGARSVITTGQSGHPMHPHYTDQTEPWSRVEYHEMLYQEDTIRANTEGRLLLKPGG